MAWLIGYPILSAVKGSTPNFKRYVIADLLTATPITYIGGLISMQIVMEVSIGQAFSMAVLPFIPGGIMKTCAAAFVAVKLNSIIRR